MTCVPKEVIYRSLGQVLRALSFQKEVPEVKNVIRLSCDTGLISGWTKESENFEWDGKIKRADRRKSPFIVIEGLDGTGKTTLTRFLSMKLNMKLMSTPPKNSEAFIKARDYFDSQDEWIRRAYYSLGNYLAANEVQMTHQPVVMDRFWHSTAAYALAHLKKSGELKQQPVLEWPVDLLQPDLVIFLQVSEEERLRRHATRKAFTNTPEEQTLAEDKAFRQNLLQYYRSIVGPRLQELEISGEQAESQARILTEVLNAFPGLQHQSTQDTKSL